MTCSDPAKHNKPVPGARSSYEPPPGWEPEPEPPIAVIGIVGTPGKPVRTARVRVPARARRLGVRASR